MTAPVGVAMSISRPMCSHGGCPMRAASGSAMCFIHGSPLRPAPRGDCDACGGTGWCLVAGLPAVTECACRGDHPYATLVWHGTATPGSAARTMARVEAEMRAAQG